MNTWNLVAGAAFVVILFFGYSFLKRRDKDPNSRVDFDDLVMSAPQSDGKRRISSEKVLMWGGFAVTSWGLVYMIGADKVTDAIYIGYGTLWIAPIIAHMFAAQPSPTPPAP